MIPEKLARLTEQELQNLYQSKKKLTKEQRLLRSILDDVLARRKAHAEQIEEKSLLNALDRYQFKRKI